MALQTLKQEGSGLSSLTDNNTKLPTANTAQSHPSLFPQLSPKESKLQPMQPDPGSSSSPLKPPTGAWAF